MNIRNLYPGSWGSNCYLLTVGKHAAIVDPSASVHSLINAIKCADAKLEYIFLTHGHFDHITSMDKLRDETNAPALIHEKDGDMPSDSFKNAFFQFFQMKSPPYRMADVLLKDGDEFLLGDEKIRVIHTPGHSMGSICLLCNEEFLITGDTLFSDNVGRCDLYGGSNAVLADSLRLLEKLPQNLIIYPGHGESARLGDALNAVTYDY
jgi:glyoxylase-like metal-dependent hydrolase (beta-lactamase superfamily II)